MANQSTKNITLPKALIRRKQGIVILSLKEYEKLKRIAGIPIYFLRGKAARAVDRLVGEGRKAYREGKCKRLKSLSELD